MALTADQEAALARLNGYNGNGYNVTTNPLGFARGGNQAGVFVAALKDVATAGELVGTVTTDLQAQLDQAAGSAQTATDKAQEASDSAEAAAQSAVNAQTWDPSFYYTITQVDAAIAANVSDPILPITLTAPADGATDIGDGGSYTFVGTAYYSDYGIAQASRAVRIYNAAGDTLVTTFTTAGAGTTVVGDIAGTLAVSTSYQAEMVYTDALGNETVSPSVGFTTIAVFKPGIGEAYEGGFLAFEQFGDGLLYDLVLAPKSTEATRAWNGGSSTLINTYSRVNGPQNTAAAVLGTVSDSAQLYAKGISIGGVAGILGAVDELRAIAAKMRTSGAPTAAFQSGGSEAFQTAYYYSSTEVSASSAMTWNLESDLYSSFSKSNPAVLRPIKRIEVTPPYPIGTAMEGGYLAAYFTDLSSGSPLTYMLIVADKATEVTRAWQITASALGGVYLSRTNGSAPTEANGTSTNAAAFNYCFSLTSGGQTDWYLGAIDEILAIRRVHASMPAGQQSSLSASWWSATEVDASNSKLLNTAGTETQLNKTGVQLVRPIRRVLLAA